MGGLKHLTTWNHLTHLRHVLSGIVRDVNIGILVKKFVITVITPDRFGVRSV
jgi:hypothetical protein